MRRLDRAIGREPKQEPFTLFLKEKEEKEVEKGVSGAATSSFLFRHTAFMCLCHLEIGWLD